MIPMIKHQQIVIRLPRSATQVGSDGKGFVDVATLRGYTLQVRTFRHHNYGAVRVTLTFSRERTDMAWMPPWRGMLRMAM